MPPSEPRVAYVLKMYPRLAETFILNEILAHEAAGLHLDLFSLRPPVDGRFHQGLGRVQAEVTYVPHNPLKVEPFWKSLCAARGSLPGLDRVLQAGAEEGANNVFQALHVARAARERRITHFHAHFATVAADVARLASLMTGIPYSFTTHAKDIYDETVDENAYRRKLRDAATVVTVSDFNVRYLAERYGPDARNVRRIYNGLDLSDFPYAPLAEDGPPVILGVGRLVPKKGFADLIEACALLARRGRAFKCDIIGGGLLRGELAQKVADLGLEDVVTLDGPRPREEVIERMRRAAVLAAPCVIAESGNRDGLPTVLLEAMALGIPCVATPVTGIPELVRDGETGLLAAESDPAALAGALERVLDDGGLRKRISAAGRRLIEEQFDIHRNTRLLRGIFAAPAEATRVAVEVT